MSENEGCTHVVIEETQQVLSRRDAILASISLVAKQFLRGPSWEDNIQAALKHLGLAAEVSRVYLFQISVDKRNRPTTAYRYEWVAPGVESLVGSPGLHSFTLLAGGFLQWEKNFREGLPVQLHTRQLSWEEKALLSMRQARSVLAVPIFMEQEWWGVVGFEECRTEREWAPAEIDALKTAAEIVGASMERNRIDEQIRDSEERFRILFEYAPDAYYLCDLSGTFIDGNKAAEQLTGYSKAEIIGKNFLTANLLRPTDIPRATEVFAKSVLGYPTGPDEFALTRKDGQQVYFEIRTYPTKWKGQALVLGIARDVTERRETAQALLQSEEQYRATINAMDYVIYVVDSDVKIILANSKCEQSAREFGFKGDLVGKEPWVVFPFLPEDIRGEYDHIFNTGEGRISREHHQVGEETIIAESERIPIMKQGKVDQVLVVVRDLTQWVQAEAEREEQRIMLQTILDTSPDLFFFKDRHSVYRLCNESFARVLDLSVTDIIGSTDYDFQGYPPEDVERFLEEDRQVFEMGQPLVREYFEVSLSVPRWTEYIKTPIRNNLGEIVGLLGTVRDITKRKETEQILRDREEALREAHDVLEQRVMERTALLAQVNDALRDEITERKQIEQELHEREEKYRSIFENIQDVYFEASWDGMLEEITPSIELLSGYTRGDLIGRPISDLYLDPSSEAKFRETIEARGHVTDYELLMKSADGDPVFCSVSSQVIVDNRSGARKIVGTLRDISQRKAAEEQSRASLKEKDVLLREIHHRVKNNLQVISSLLYLQSLRLTDKQALRSLEDSQNRIKSMALVHENLYKSEDLARIDFAKYTNNLIQQLVLSYGLGVQNIDLVTKVETVSLSIGTAIPCGLLLNELISNSLKHAFPDGRQGEVYVELTSHKHGHFVLIVRDNGVGLPNDFELTGHQSLGLQLVDTLVKQIDGTIEFSREQGAAFRISFRESESEETGHHGTV